MIRHLVWGLLTAGVHLSLLSGTPNAQEINSDQFTYTNARFGFSFDFPEGFIAGPSPGNNDGRSFSGHEGAVEITVFAHYPLEDFKAERTRSREYLRIGGADITYTAEGTDWFVFSGYDVDGLIFYDRVINAKDCLGDTIAVSFSITYPRSHTGLVEPGIYRISSSLKGCE